MQTVLSRAMAAALLALAGHNAPAAGPPSTQAAAPQLLATAPQAVPPPAAVASPSAPNSIRGITRCAADLGLGLPVAGRIANTLVREGQVVRAGEVLMRLDQNAEQLDVERRRVQWQGMAELTMAQNRQVTALAQLEAARRIYQSSQGISREELENRELVHKNAQSDVERLKTTKEVERLDHLNAREALERRNLRAPSPGIVTRLVKLSGESVQAHEPALRLCDLSSILFVANVPAAAGERLRSGGTVNLQVGEPAVPMQGRLTFVSPVVDSASGLREVKVELIRPGPKVRPGVPATLEL